MKETIDKKNVSENGESGRAVDNGFPLKNFVLPPSVGLQFSFKINCIVGIWTRSKRNSRWSISNPAPPLFFKPRRIAVQLQDPLPVSCYISVFVLPVEGNQTNCFLANTPSKCESEFGHQNIMSELLPARTCKSFECFLHRKDFIVDSNASSSQPQIAPSPAAPIMHSYVPAATSNQMSFTSLNSSAGSFSSSTSPAPSTSTKSSDKLHQIGVEIHVNHRRFLLHSWITKPVKSHKWESSNRGRTMSSSNASHICVSIPYCHNNQEQHKTTTSFVLSANSFSSSLLPLPSLSHLVSKDALK